MKYISRQMIALGAGIAASLSMNIALAGSPDVAPVHHEDRGEPRAYFQALFGYSLYDFKVSDLENGFTAKKINSEGAAYHLSLGYQITSRIGAEFGVAWLYRPRVIGLRPAPKKHYKKEYNFKNNMVYIAGTYNFPIIFGVKLFGLGGVGYVSRSSIKTQVGQALDSKVMFRPVYGAGVMWQAFKHWALVANWIQMPGKNNQPASNFIGAGFRYRFYV